jgi:hypothetical protein
MNDSNIPEINFITLVLTLSSSAWVGLGKVSDPVTGEIREDIKGVKYTIDILLMLREKTKGNLTDEENKVLNSIISDLQVNYAETVFSSKKEQETPSSDAESSKSSEPGAKEDENLKEGNNL